MNQLVFFAGSEIIYSQPITVEELRNFDIPYFNALLSSSLHSSDTFTVELPNEFNSERASSEIKRYLSIRKKKSHLNYKVFSSLCDEYMDYRRRSQFRCPEHDHIIYNLSKKLSKLRRKLYITLELIYLCQFFCDDEVKDCLDHRYLVEIGPVGGLLSLFDDQNFESIINNFKSTFYADYMRARESYYNQRNITNRVREISKVLLKSYTIEQLADQIGVDRFGLKEFIEQIN